MMNVIYEQFLHRLNSRIMYDPFGLLHRAFFSSCFKHFTPVCVHELLSFSLFYFSKPSFLLANKFEIEKNKEK